MFISKDSKCIMDNCKTSHRIMHHHGQCSINVSWWWAGGGVMTGMNTGVEECFLLDLLPLASILQTFCLRLFYFCSYLCIRFSLLGDTVYLFLFSFHWAVRPPFFQMTLTVLFLIAHIFLVSFF